jgi:hypothetical protein
MRVRVKYNLTISCRRTRGVLPRISGSKTRYGSDVHECSEGSEVENKAPGGKAVHMCGSRCR